MLKVGKMRGVLLHSNALLDEGQKNGKSSGGYIRILLKPVYAFYCGQMLLKILELEYYKPKELSSSHNFFEEDRTMTKYTKVYIRNKKQSNISLPLRFSLLRSIFVQNMSVKEAAAKWKVHYSSAKIIARTARRNKLYFLFDREFSNNATPAIQCSYREVNPEDRTPLRSLDVKVNDEERESDHTNGDNAPHLYGVQGNKIEVHSTIGWNYMTLSGSKV